MEKKNINKAVLFSLGMLIMTFGARMLLYSGVGTSAMDALSVGVSNIIGLSIGLSINVVGICLVSISAILRKEKINIYPILISLLFGLLFDMWSGLVFNKLTEPTNFLAQLGILAVAIFLSALGTAIYILAKVSVSTLDYFMLSIQLRFRTSLQTSRIIMEGVLLIAALIVKGPVGLGTIIIMITFGPVLQFCYKHLEKISEKSKLILE